MSQEQPKRPPFVVVTEGPFKGFQGPVVGIDQQKGTVQIRVSRVGVMFGRKQTTIELDVRKVRRLIV